MRFQRTHLGGGKFPSSTSDTVMDKKRQSIVVQLRYPYEGRALVVPSIGLVEQSKLVSTGPTVLTVDGESLPSMGLAEQQHESSFCWPQPGEML